MIQTRTRDDLVPLAYQQNVVAYLRQHESHVWSWASSAQAEQDYLEQMRTMLLKQCYRLEADGHADLLDTCTRVAQRLGVDAPVTLYQAHGDGSMNAALYCAPGEAHVVFTGPVLNRLRGAEIEAVLGHELAHYCLWERDEKSHLIADRVMTAAAIDGRGSDSHVHTARRLRLYTEIFADRGSYVGCGDLHATIAALVKMTTGLDQVSASGYLRQADEVFTRVARGGQTADHPELFIRARALRLWVENDPGIDQWLAAEIEDDGGFESLCLLGQQRTMTLTRRVLNELLAPRWMQSDQTLAHARAFFVDFRPSGTEPVGAEDLNCADKDARDYWCYLLLDFARADRNMEDVALAHTLLLAERWGLREPFEAVVAKELRLNKRELTQLRKQAPELVRQAEAAHS
jgi:hypothetical protein